MCPAKASTAPPDNYILSTIQICKATTPRIASEKTEHTVSAKTTKEQNTILRVSAYLFRYKGLFWLTISLAATATALEVAVPMTIKVILDNLENANALQNLIRGISFMLALYIGSEIFNSLRIRFNNKLEQQVLKEMRRDLHTKLLRLPVSFYDQRKSGEISSRVIEDVASVERALLDGTEQGSTALLKIIGVSAFLFWMNPLLASFVFLPVPILIFLGTRYSRGSRVIWKGVRESSGDLNSLLVEDIQGNRLIQTFGLQKRESARFEEKAETLRQRTLRAMYRWSLYSPFTNLITKSGILSIVAIGGYYVIQDSGDFTMGKLIAFFLYANMLYQPISQLHSLNHLIAAGRASGARVFEVLDAEIEVDEPQSPQPIPKGPIEIQLNKVDFTYPGRPAMLQDFSLTLEANKVTAIVGHTGAGKSTVANLAMRTYDVTAGTVTLSGTDIRDISLQQLHNTIGHVAQDPFLFEGSVRDNMLLAKADASETQILKALEQACALEFVQALPDQIDTNIGEKGIRLSQGEKQRLTIARVLLKNPPFVILDEATASVDTITERKIQQALENLIQQRTVLVIAHRLSTVRKADKIIVMQKGRILETGSHETLLKQDSHYADLWRHQSDQIPAYSDSIQAG